MKNSNQKLHPINEIEKKICQNKEFQVAIKTGKVREFHLEGSIETHIINILDYIDKNYKKTEDYETLRILAILHDVGKFAFLEKYIDIYLPIMPKAEQNKFITASRNFANKYPVSNKFRREMSEYQFTSEHSYVSYLFAKQFLKDKKLLNILKYHDMAIDFWLIYQKTGKYNINKFKEIFSKLDLKLYLLFVECDKCNPLDSRLPWLKAELKKHKIID
jgi:hypothetical protein